MLYRMCYLKIFLSCWVQKIPWARILSMSVKESKFHSGLFMKLREIYYPWNFWNFKETSLSLISFFSRDMKLPIWKGTCFQNRRKKLIFFFSRPVKLTETFWNLVHEVSWNLGNYFPFWKTWNFDSLMSVCNNRFKIFLDPTFR